MRQVCCRGHPEERLTRRQVGCIRPCTNLTYASRQINVRPTPKEESASGGPMTLQKSFTQ